MKTLKPVQKQALTAIMIPCMAWTPQYIFQHLTDLKEIYLMDRSQLDYSKWPFPSNHKRSCVCNWAEERKINVIQRDESVHKSLDGLQNFTQQSTPKNRSWQTIVREMLRRILGLG